MVLTRLTRPPGPAADYRRTADDTCPRALVSAWTGFAGQSMERQARSTHVRWNRSSVDRSLSIASRRVEAHPPAGWLSGWFLDGRGAIKRGVSGGARPWRPARLYPRGLHRIAS